MTIIRSNHPRTWPHLTTFLLKMRIHRSAHPRAWPWPHLMTWLASSKRESTGGHIQIPGPIWQHSSLGVQSTGVHIWQWACPCSQPPYSPSWSSCQWEWEGSTRRSCRWGWDVARRSCRWGGDVTLGRLDCRGMWRSWWGGALSQECLLHTPQTIFWLTWLYHYPFDESQVWQDFASSALTDWWIWCLDEEAGGKLAGIRVGEEMQCCGVRQDSCSCPAPWYCCWCWFHESVFTLVAYVCRKAFCQSIEDPFCWSLQEKDIFQAGKR